MVQRMWEAEEFAVVPDRVRKQWLGVTKPVVRTTRDQEFVWTEGASTEELVVVLSGTIELQEQRAQGGVVVRELSGPCVVGWGVVSGLPHSASGRAVGTVEWVAISREELLDLLRAAPELALRGFSTLSSWLASASAKVKGVSPTRTRVAGSLLDQFDQGKDTIFVSLRALARELGVSVPRVSLLLRRLEESGAISRGGQTGPQHQLRLELKNRRILRKASHQDSRAGPKRDGPQVRASRKLT